MRLDVLRERNYRLFITGFGISYTLYWITLLAVGWWMWETTRSATWVGFVFFCDLFPAILVTPWASALADRGNRFRILKFVLWIQVGTGVALAGLALAGALTPVLLSAFVFVEGALIGFSQPAFFGLINRLVKPDNLSAAVAFNSSVSQATYIVGPLLAGMLFTFGLEIAPLAFAANAIGTLVYLGALARIDLYPAPEREAQPASGLGHQITDGLKVFWGSAMVYRAMVLILGVAILQRPLISLMPGINDRFEVFDAAFFTLLTASFMAGSVVAGLIHTVQNSHVGMERRTTIGAGALVVVYLVFFTAIDWFEDSRLFAVGCLFSIGLFCAYVWTGNTIILQAKIAEHLRSRVLGNSFMMTRAVGALAVIVAGFVVEKTGFAMGMSAIAIFVALAVPLLLLLRRTVSLPVG
ncbi:MAG: MFS transporter [Pseudomonadota bacterium]